MIACLRLENYGKRLTFPDNLVSYVQLGMGVNLCRKGEEIMFNKEIVVRCESGLHNRQATYFVQKANEFESSIYLESGNRKMNAKSLLGIMSLGIATGTVITLSAVGSDAEAAVNALEELLQRDVY